MTSLTTSERNCQVGFIRTCVNTKETIIGALPQNPGLAVARHVRHMFSVEDMSAMMHIRNGPDAFLR
jgi:hypothetical protein